MKIFPLLLALTLGVLPMHDVHANKNPWITGIIGFTLAGLHYYFRGSIYTTKQLEKERGMLDCKESFFSTNGPCAQQADALIPLPDYHWKDLLLPEKERDAKLAPLVALAQQVGATPNPLQPINQMACELQCDRCKDLATVINVHSVIFLGARVRMNAVELADMGLLKPDQAKRIIKQVDGEVPEWLKKEDFSPKVTSLLERIEDYSALRG